MQHANDNQPRPQWFDDLLLQYEPFLRGRCKALAPADAEDVYQESACSALTRWASYRRDGHFPTWLNFIARSTAHERRKRAEQNTPSHLNLTVQPTQDARLILEDELASIPDEFSTPVALAGLGYSRLEIAEFCNDKHAPRWKLDRGRAMLRAANDNDTSNNEHKNNAAA